LAPPLIIRENEIDEIVAKLKSAIDRTAKDCAKN
jgi:adenosylmethionine-8-amino-7-oxononanoate aminotransferase